MSSSEKPLDTTQMLTFLMNKLLQDYWKYIWEEIKKNPSLKEKISAFLLIPEEIVFYFGKHHLAIEYLGPIFSNNIKYEARMLNARYINYSESDDLMDSILGFEYDGTTGFKIQVSDVIENYYSPTSAALDLMIKNKWNFFAQDMSFSINGNNIEFKKDVHTRLINCFFYSTINDSLAVRHIKWMDVFPIQREDIDEDFEKLKIKFWPNSKNLAISDAYYNYPLPDDFQFEKLIILNRFIELIISHDVSETMITKFLSEDDHKFILKMAFFSKEIYPQKKCLWQNDIDKDPIQPDFFVEDPQGFSNIVEFKLPYIKNNPIVGISNRESFSSEINSYISQTRVYGQYFEDSSNKRHVVEKYGIKVNYPQRNLVIGRRYIFGADTWKEIENDYKNLRIITYDDIIDGVMNILYS